MKTARGLKKTDDGHFTCTVGSLQRHFKAILRFVRRTDAVVCITRKGKNDLVLMSYKHYLRITGEIDAMRHTVRKTLYSNDND